MAQRHQAGRAAAAVAPWQTTMPRARTHELQGLPPVRLMLPLIALVGALAVPYVAPA